MAASTPRSLLANAATRPAYGHRWARWAIASITRCARVSLPRSNVNCSTAPASKPRPRRVAVFDFIEGLCDVHCENVGKLTGSSGGGSPYRGLRIMPRVTRLAPSSGVRGLARYPGTKLDSRTDKQEYEHRLRGPRNERWEVKG